MEFDKQAVRSALAAHGSIAAAARSLGVERRRLSEFVNADPTLARSRSAAPSIEIDGDTATITGPKMVTSDHEKALREVGLDPSEWILATLKRWETYHGDARWTSTYRRRPSLAVISPAEHVPALARVPETVRGDDGAELIVVEGDHQAPYFDPALDACATAFVKDMQPVEHVFLGDTADFPTISRHPDHPAASAAVKECLDSAYGILRRRAEAAPNAKRLKLKGNHDWRVESELLQRAERLYGIAPVGETEPALSLRRLLHLDDLGVGLIEDSRGWEHGEIEVVPGDNGLVVRHGFLTGAGTALRTLDKLGRSIIVGHGHQKESSYRLKYPAKRLQQGFVAGTMSRNDEVFPHFAVNPNWHQGFVTVTRWPDGQFLCEHTVFQDGALYWRDKRWAAIEVGDGYEVRRDG